MKNQEQVSLFLILFHCVSFYVRYRLRTFNLTGTQASGAYIDMAGSTLHNSLYTLYIGLPSSVSCSMGVGYLVAECHALTANLTLCHRKHLLKNCVGNL